MIVLFLLARIAERTSSILNRSILKSPSHQLSKDQTDHLADKNATLKKLMLTSNNKKELNDLIVDYENELFHFKSLDPKIFEFQHLESYKVYAGSSQVISGARGLGVYFGGIGIRFTSPQTVTNTPQDIILSFNIEGGNNPRRIELKIAEYSGRTSVNEYFYRRELEQAERYARELERIMIYRE